MLTMSSLKLLLFCHKSTTVAMTAPMMTFTGFTAITIDANICGRIPNAPLNAVASDAQPENTPTASCICVITVPRIPARVENNDNPAITESMPRIRPTLSAMKENNPSMIIRTTSTAPNTAVQSIALVISLTIFRISLMIFNIELNIFHKCWMIESPRPAVFHASANP